MRDLPGLRLAPAGVVPQRKRRPRPIMDYTYSGTNQDTLPEAPTQAMQFGATLQRLLQQLVFCDPTHGPPLLAKIDLADGYNRVPLSPDAALGLAVVIPSDTPQTSPSLIAIPLALPMGWKHSPPLFCAYTKTIADLTNQTTTPAPATQHPLLTRSQSSRVLPRTYAPTVVILGATNQKPLNYTDVYIDDFLLVVQPPHHLQTLNKLLFTIISVFQDPHDTPIQHVISHLKLDKGDAAFSF